MLRSGSLSIGVESYICLPLPFPSAGAIPEKRSLVARARENRVPLSNSLRGPYFLMVWPGHDLLDFWRERDIASWSNTTFLARTEYVFSSLVLLYSFLFVSDRAFLCSTRRIFVPSPTRSIISTNRADTISGGVIVIPPRFITDLKAALKAVGGQRGGTAL